MSIVEQARAELERVNFGEGDSAVMLGLLRTFFGQWDSGGGVSVASEVLARLIAGQPLTPLTGGPDEWHDPLGDGLLLQNVRCGTVFKSPDGTTWDASGPDPIPVEFPYNPATRQVEMPIYQVTVDDLVRAGVDRHEAEFVHGEQWPAGAFEPIGDAAARVVKSLTVGADDTAGSLKPVRERVSDALGGLMARKPTGEK
jgi:hypothetical protein